MLLFLDNSCLFLCMKFNKIKINVIFQITRKGIMHLKSTLAVVSTPGKSQPSSNDIGGGSFVRSRVH